MCIYSSKHKYCGEKLIIYTIFLNRFVFILAAPFFFEYILSAARSTSAQIIYFYPRALCALVKSLTHKTSRRRNHGAKNNDH